ncbi:restriction endonuclease [Arthrobacter psychrochitiniphilus]|uniref:Restriction endonuclease n=1 Tax=Arthrobacter psychrochitiniphilus TaxID=291045 RepID=A0A2V3DM41_9MICC|nr:restriction endonuclease [Arthrobacter psychrochitiniphilus]NYG16052.1 restriction system protein [Arthrobacter psychrochitiniphilus]PXA64002.1 restriction endonuclease [Arthrobacter psychrochitiniphilus]
MTARVLRAGIAGEPDQWAVNYGFAGGGFHEIGSLEPFETSAVMQSAMEDAFKGEHPGKITNYTGQLNALRHSVKVGDVILNPLKTSRKVTIGVVPKEYTYEDNEPDATKRHQIGVDWQQTNVPRAAFKDEILNTLNGAMSIFRAERDEAENRLRAVFDRGVDPGLYGRRAMSTSAAAAQPSTDDFDDVTEPIATPTIQSIRDRVQTYVIENSSGHKLTHLLAEILRTKGFTCEISPEGPDGGVDILVGSGPLGLGKPKLVVEVKSAQTQISSLVVRGLQSAITTKGASQGLLVARGGLNKQAQNEIRNDRLKIRAWEAEQVLDQLFEAYEFMPGATRRLIPLKRAWVLDEEDNDG